LSFDLSDTSFDITLFSFTAYDGCIFFVNGDFSAVPTFNVASSNLNPFSSEITNPVKMAISPTSLSSVSETRAYTATILSPPRSLFTTRVANASLSTSSEITSKDGHFELLFQDRQKFFHIAYLLVINQNVRIFVNSFHFFCIGYEKGRCSLCQIAFLQPL
jgi:hypothetical protein